MNSSPSDWSNKRYKDRSSNWIWRYGIWSSWNGENFDEK